MKHSTISAVAIIVYLFVMALAFLDQIDAVGGAAAFIKEYQTLIAGSFALVSIFYLSEQLRLQRKQNRDQITLARQAELDALDVALVSCDHEEAIFHDEEGKTIGVSQMRKPSDEEIEYVRARTLPSIARSLQFLSRQVGEWNHGVGAMKDEDFLADGTSKKKSNLRMLNKTRDRLREAVERRRLVLLPRD